MTGSSAVTTPLAGWETRTHDRLALHVVIQRAFEPLGVPGRPVALRFALGHDLLDHLSHVSHHRRELRVRPAAAQQVA
jgi:hypothetical protein